MSVWTAHWRKDGTRIEAVMAAVKGRVAARELSLGERLPSVRGFAATLKVSPSTVAEAFDRLAAEGLIRSRRGAGFYVNAPLAPFAIAERAPRREREIDPLWVARQSLDAAPGALTPGCGWLPPSWLPEAAIRRALRALSRGPPEALTDYGSPLGAPALRQALARRLGERGAAASPDQILLTESGTQAIDLVCRFLIEPGDAVLVDDPCYFNFHALLGAHRVKIVGAPYTANGPDVEAFAAALESHRPRLYITNSGLHNPTGASLTPAVAHRLLKLADAAGLTIVEDDIFADFEETPAPRLAALDGLARVIAIGSFSKTLSASARCGYIAARRDWIEPLADLRIATAFGGGRLAQQLVLALLTDGGYRRHLEALRPRLHRAMDETIRRLEAIGVAPRLNPQAGMFVWCKLPEGVKAADVARLCARENVVVAPGDVFSVSQSAAGFMRFNVAQCADPRVFSALERAIGEARRGPE